MFKAILEPFRHPKPVIELGAGRSLGSAAGGKPKAKAKDWGGTLMRIWSYLAERKDTSRCQTSREVRRHARC